MPNYGHLSLSCAKIERPSPLEKPFCIVQLFAQNRSRNYRQKVTATTLFQTASYSDFQLLAQMAHVRFHRRKRVHTRLSAKDRTQGHTRRNRGRFGWGWYHCPRSVPHVSETLRGRVSERQTLPLLGLGRVYSRRTQKACGTAMRLCASLFRGVAAPMGCVIFLLLSKLRLVRPALRAFPRVRDEGGYHDPRRAPRAAETPDGRLSKRLICRFLRLGSLH